MNDVLSKLKAPAIGLIVTAILNGLLGGVSLLSGLLRFSGIIGQEKLPANAAEKTGYLIGTFGGYGVGVLSLIFAPVIFYGGFKMLKGESRGVAICASVLAILPLTSCCFAVGAVFGVWAIVVLMQTDVKSFYQNGGNQTNLYPPQPPQNW